MNAGRRHCLERATALALGLALPFSRAHASTAFPNRPITMWVPWAAGGATDVSLRGLNDFVAALDISAHGFAFIVEPGGDLIAASSGATSRAAPTAT